MSRKVALIQGGLGAEREVSKVTGHAFGEALVALGYTFEVVEAGDDLPQKLATMKPDVALLALHGKYAEDGTVQGVCEYLKIPYSGSGVYSSALCFNKVATYQMLKSAQVPHPRHQVVRSHEIASVKVTLPYPVVVKPAREGSSVGISIVKNEEDLLPALKLAAKSDSLILVDEYIAGMELTVAVVGGKAHTPVEIVPKQGYYDYNNKYTAGNTEYFLPPRLPDAVIEKCQRYAQMSIEACQVRHFARVDFRIDENQNPYVIEVNTLPGCTPTSLFPKSMKYDGITFEQVIAMFVETAGLDYEGVV
ncbi:MAG: D-alanine--D-alanine ligase [Bdellovibrionales bacterium]|nr:D-alanine--D-alanine ligase [Bdellovibrionales bacterium]